MALALPEIAEDCSQSGAEADVVELLGNRRGLIHGHRIERVPFYDDVGAGDVAEEGDDIAERRAVKMHLGNLTVQHLVDRAVFRINALTLGDFLIALGADIGPIVGIAQNIVVGNRLFLSGIELAQQVSGELLAVGALLQNNELVLHERLDAQGVIVVGIKREDLVENIDRFVVFAFFDGAAGGLDQIGNGVSAVRQRLPASAFAAGPSASCWAPSAFIYCCLIARADQRLLRGADRGIKRANLLGEKIVGS